jgi:hypothetical protein
MCTGYSLRWNANPTARFHERMTTFGPALTRLRRRDDRMSRVPNDRYGSLSSFRLCADDKAKSAVAKPSIRKFLGFSFTSGRGPRPRIAPQAGIVVAQCARALEI